MKKGFTLIELLAVIIILAIIAIIATPIIIDVIESSKESANLRSIEGYASAIKQKYYNDSLGGAKPTIDSTFLSNIDTSGGEVKCDSVLYNNGTILYKCSVQNSEKKYCYANEQHYACDNQDFLAIFTGNGGTPTLEGNSIIEIVLSNFPYLETNGNGCVTPTDNNYSYMGGCYIKGERQSGKDIFYFTMYDLTGLTEEEVTLKFFDSEGNFVEENFDNWAFTDGGLTEEMLQESGKNTAFEMAFNMTPEELFAMQSLNNNYIWYSGFLWRIMGINADGSVRLITDENVTAIPYHESNSNWDGSYAKDWLNNYFYPRLKGNNIIKEETWCSETTTDENSARTICTNNLSAEKSKVGLLTIDEYNLAGGIYSYLNIYQSQWTITPYSNFHAWMVNNGGEAYNNPVSDMIGLRVVINVNSNVIITGGNGTLGEIWSSETGPYILNEDKNIEVLGKLNEKATSGEYVLFAGRKYRVVDKDSNGNTKLILDGYYEESGKIFKTEYNDTNTNIFSTTIGIGQKLNGDVLNWLTNNDDIEKEKLVSNYPWYQNDFDYGQSYTVSLNEESPTRSIQATVGLIRVGEMLSGQSSSILTKEYTVISLYINASYYWTMTPYKNSSYALRVSYGGWVEEDSYFDTPGLRPVIVVNSDVNITGGNGTWSNPYQI